MTLQTWQVGDTTPAITATVMQGTSVFNLAGTTSTFNMRQSGATALAVSAAATVVGASNLGQLSYAWAPTDLAASGTFITWFDVTTTASTAIRSTPEVVIEVLPHSTLSDLQPGYVELAEFKSALNLTGQTFMDLDCQNAILAAARAIDGACGRHFWKDVTTSVHYYDAPAIDMVVIDDTVTVTEFAVDFSGVGTNFIAQDTTFFVAGPYNNPSVDRPFEWIRLRNYTSPYLPTWYQKSVRVTGQHGWPEVPRTVKEANMILAHRLLRRAREAPFSIMTVGMESMRAVKIEQSDPDVYFLLQDYIRTRPFT